MTGKDFEMRAYKFDGKLHYEQTLSLKETHEDHVVLKGAKGRVLKHHTRNSEYRFEENTLEYFFIDRWYTAALVFDDDNNVTRVYCNIARPCTIKEDAVEFVDLDIDVAVRDGEMIILDEDEFEEHRHLYGYGKEIEGKVFEAIEQVKEDIIHGNYPFDRDILNKT